MWTLPFLNKLSKSQRVLWHLNKKMCSFGNQDFQQGQTILVEEEYVKQDQQREAAETYSLLHVLWCGEQNPFCAKKSAPLIQFHPMPNENVSAEWFNICFDQFDWFDLSNMTFKYSISCLMNRWNCNMASQPWIYVWIRLSQG